MRRPMTEEVLQAERDRLNRILKTAWEGGYFSTRYFTPREEVAAGLKLLGLEENPPGLFLVTNTDPMDGSEEWPYFILDSRFHGSLR